MQVELNNVPVATVNKAGLYDGGGRVGQGWLTDCYALSVNPGVDAAFMVLLVVLLNQIYHKPDN